MRNFKEGSKKLIDWREWLGYHKVGALMILIAGGISIAKNIGPSWTRTDELLWGIFMACFMAGGMLVDMWLNMRMRE